MRGRERWENVLSTSQGQGLVILRGHRKRKAMLILSQRRYKIIGVIKFPDRSAAVNREGVNCSSDISIKEEMESGTYCRELTEVVTGIVKASVILGKLKAKFCA